MSTHGSNENDALRKEIAELTAIIARQNSSWRSQGGYNNSQYHYHNPTWRQRQTQRIPLGQFSSFVPASSLPLSYIPFNSKAKSSTRSNASSVSRYKIDRRVAAATSTEANSSLVVAPTVDKQPLRRSLNKSPNKASRQGQKTLQHEFSSPEFLIKNNGRSLTRIRKKSLLNSSLRQGSQSQGSQSAIASRVLRKSIKRLRFSSNRLCSFYQRFGRCLKEDKTENCPYVHCQHLSQIGTPRKLRKSGNGFKPLPCYYFGLGACKNSKCPFPHVQPSPKKKKEPKAEKDKKKPKPTVKRYFDEHPSSTSECITLIPILHPSTNNPASERSPVVVKIEEEDHMVSVVSEPEPDPRRERLMEKVALLKAKFGHLRRKNVPAPDYLPFSKS